MRDWFRKFSHGTAAWAGSPTAFFLACLIIIIWGLSGHLFHYSDTWQLVINTGTTIITFLMVFLIQSTQNRDAREIHVKLDELIRSNKSARNRLIDLGKLSDKDLDTLQAELCALRDQSSHRIDEIQEHRRHRQQQGSKANSQSQIETLRS